MNRTDMITTLSSAYSYPPRMLEARQRRIQDMTTAGLKRELLMRGLVDYDEPEDSDYEDDRRDEPVTTAFLGIVRDPLCTD